MTHHSSLPLVIVNPASADGATRENWPKIASDLRTHFGAFSVTFTESAGHARELAAEAAKQKTSLIIACGGDGTISEVANGIIESKQESELAILPGGTGSDFRRTIGLPTNIAATEPALPRGRTPGVEPGGGAFVTDA